MHRVHTRPYKHTYIYFSFYLGPRWEARWRAGTKNAGQWFTYPWSTIFNGAAYLHAQSQSPQPEQCYLPEKGFHISASFFRVGLHFTATTRQDDHAASAKSCIWMGQTWLLLQSFHGSWHCATFVVFSLPYCTRLQMTDSFTVTETPHESIAKHLYLYLVGLFKCFFVMCLFFTFAGVLPQHVLAI